MHSSAHSSSSSSSHMMHSRQHQQHEQAECDRSGSAAAAGATTPVNSSGSSSVCKEPLDPATAAAAAALGAEADRLLKALNLQLEQHHPERSRKQQRHKGIKVHRPAAIEDGLGFEDVSKDSSAAAFDGDEPICIPVEYLRL
jgi:hypothetical protein